MSNPEPTSATAAAIAAEQALRSAPAAAPNLISGINRGIHDCIDAGLREAGATGLTSSHGNILAALYAFGPLPMNRIAALIGRRKSTLTVLADKLESNGYIIRRNSTEDTRVRELCLTEKGTAFQQEFVSFSAELADRLWKGFSDDEQHECMRLLMKMRANLPTENGGD